MDKLLKRVWVRECPGNSSGQALYLRRAFSSPQFTAISSWILIKTSPHTRLTGTAGRVHCVRIFTHFPCYEPACWSLNFMHFQTSVIRLVDRLTWFYRFGITLQINLSPKVCDLSVMFWINIYKLGLKKYPLKSRNFGNLVCLYLGYHGNYTRFICF